MVAVIKNESLVPIIPGKHLLNVYLAKRMTRVYFMGVLLSLAHLHLLGTMKCGLYTYGQVSDAAHTRPLYVRISEPTFRHAKQEHDTSKIERDDDDINTVQ